MKNGLNILKKFSNSDKNRLQHYLKGKIAIIGMGNPLKGDDNAGNLVVKELIKKVRGEKIHFFVVENSIENYLGNIEKGKFDSVIIIDAVDFGGKAGEIKFFLPDDLINISPTTHSFSIPDLLKIYNLYNSTLIIGIQPVNLSIEGKMSQIVKESVKQLAYFLYEILKGGNDGKDKDKNR